MTNWEAQEKKTKKQNKNKQTKNNVKNNRLNWITAWEEQEKKTKTKHKKQQQNQRHKLRQKLQISVKSAKSVVSVVIEIPTQFA